MCPICQNKFENYIVDDDFKILKCLNCGLGITEGLNPNFGNYHRDETYIQEEKLFTNIFQKRIKLLRTLVKNGKVLEVGCSTGTLLSLFKSKAYQVRGVEISKKAADIAEKKGIKVYRVPFEKLEVNEKFDIIIFSHTLEHLENPALAIKKAHDFLNRGGILFIDLPNFNALSLKILKSKWSHLLPSEHLWHFTFKSLEILLKKNEFEIIFSEMSSGVWDLDDPFKELLQSLFSFKKRFFINIITLLPSFFVSRAKSGTGLMIIAKKV